MPADPLGGVVAEADPGAAADGVVVDGLVTDGGVVVDDGAVVD